MKTCMACMEDIPDTEWDLHLTLCKPIPCKMKQGDRVWRRGYDSIVSKFGTVVKVDHRFIVIFDHGHTWEQVDIPGEFFNVRRGRWYE